MDLLQGAESSPVMGGVSSLSKWFIKDEFQSSNFPGPSCVCVCVYVSMRIELQVNL